MTTIGYASLQVIPSIVGLSAAMDKELGGLKVAGKKAGKQLGDGIADGVDAAALKVQQATKKIQASRDKEAAAADKVAAAEARVEELREKGGSALKRAEAQRNAAQRAQLAALRDIEAETKDLTEAQKKLTRAQEDAARGPADAGGWLDRLKAKVSDVGGSVADAGGEAGAGFLEGFGGKIGEIGSKGGPIGTALAAAVTLSVGAGALIAAGVAEGMSNEQARADVQAKLGVDADTMRTVADAAGAAYAGNFGASMADNLEAARLAIQGGLVPDANDPGLQRVIEQLQTVNGVVGGDLTSTTKAVSILMRNYGIEAENAFDIITRGYINSGDLGDDLIDSISEYASGWKNTGLTADQALALIQQSVEKGVDNTDRGADALREFGRRVTEEGDAMVESLNSIGLNGEEMYDAFKRGGPDAFAAFDKAFDTIRGIEDPVKRNAAAMSLLGDTAGDFIGTFAQWDPSAAVDSFGEVEGAAQEAADTVGGTALSAWESLSRTVEVAADDMQDALAEAFGPHLLDLANWVTENEDDIVSFFTTAANAAADFGGATVTASGLALQAIAYVGTGMGDVVGGILEGLEYLVAGVANVADAVGADGLAEDLRGAREELKTAKNDAYGMGEGLADLAEEMINTGIQITDFDAALTDTDRTAQSTGVSIDEIGTKLGELPEGHAIEITDNSPETIQKLKELGFQVENTPTGLKITATTDGAQGIVEQWRTEQQNRPLQIRANVSLPGNLTGAPGEEVVIGTPFSGAPGLPGRAGGGMVDPSGLIRGPGSGTSDSILAAVTGGGFIRVSNQESINTAASTRANWDVIAAMNAGANIGEWFKSLPAFADGGGIGQVSSEAQRYGLTLTSGKRNGDGTSYHDTGQAGDYSNGVRTDAMLEFATFMAQTYGSNLAELIYDDPRFSMEIKDGKIVPRSFYASAGDHTNHVHVAVRGALPDLGSKSLDGDSSSPFAGGSAIAAATGGSPSGAPSAPSSSSGGGGISIPSSLTGLATAPFDALLAAGKANSGPGQRNPMAYFPEAASAAVGGQLDSLLGVLGVGNSPPWLNALSTFVSGISVTGPGGETVFDGSNLFGGGGNLFGGGPTVPMGSPVAPDTTVHGAGRGQQPGPVYNITARDTEDAFIKAQRLEKEKAATKLVRY